MNEAAVWLFAQGIYNEEHNPQGLTPIINLNQTALTPVGVDAFVISGGILLCL